MNLIFFVVYVGIFLLIIFYIGVNGMIGIFNVEEYVGDWLVWVGIDLKMVLLWILVWSVGLIGLVYVLFGGFCMVVVLDMLNGIGFLVGGLLIIVFVFI